MKIIAKSRRQACLALTTQKVPPNSAAALLLRWTIRAAAIETLGSIQQSRV